MNKQSARSISEKATAKKRLAKVSLCSNGASRRNFLGKVCGVTAAVAAAGTGLPSLLAGQAAGIEKVRQVARTATQTRAASDIGPLNSFQRRLESFRIRFRAAATEMRVPVPSHADNGDENLYPNKAGSYSKGLLHNSTNGEVDLASYNSLIHALTTGNPSDFENIILGGDVGLINPQAGLAFDMEGTDSHQMFLLPAPALSSARRAAEAVEDYWMALLRDVPFSQYATHPLAQMAIAELNKLSDYGGPRDRVTGQVTANTLFRGFTAGDLLGPYVSQFLLQPILYGAIPITQQFQVLLSLSEGGTDWMTDFPSWLDVQNGVGANAAAWFYPFGPPNRLNPTPRHVLMGRDLASYVHVDVLSEAYFNACLWCLDNNVPFNPGNPYFGSRRSKTQQGFGTFGGPHIKALVTEVATRALKVVWFQKWFVHRVLRPEEFGGLVHITLANPSAASNPVSPTNPYNLHSDVLNSVAVQQVFSKYGSYLMPHAFPEGCPEHPSYGPGPWHRGRSVRHHC